VADCDGAMNALKVRGMTLVKDERRTDQETGEQYRAVILNGHGHIVEVNSDRRGFHARADGDWQTAAINLDEGGLWSWFMKLLKGNHEET
jgi:hypothetical protein